MDMEKTSTVRYFAGSTIQQKPTEPHVALEPVRRKSFLSMLPPTVNQAPFIHSFTYHISFYL